MNPIEFGIAAALRFHLLVVVALLAGTCFGLFRGVVTPNQYISLGKLFVRPSVRETVTMESVLAGDDSRTLQVSGREAINNEMQVLAAPRLWELVVERVGAEVLLAPYTPGGDGRSGSWLTGLFHGFQAWWFRSQASADQGQSPAQAAAKLLRASVMIYPEASASVINIEHTAHSPELAKAVVDAVLDSARELHGEVFSTLASLSAVEGEVEHAESVARAAEDKFREFRIENRLYEFDASRETLMQSLGAIDQQIDETALELRRRKAERLELARLLEGVPEFRPAENGQVTLNPEHTALAARLRELEQFYFENERRELSGSQRDYLRQKELIAAEIEKTKLELQRQKQVLDLIPAPLEHPRRARIVERLDEIDVALKVLEETQSKLTVDRGSRQQELRELETLWPRLRELELDSRQKRTTADRLAEHLASLRNLQRLAGLNLSSVQPLHEGSFEPTKIAPQRGRLLVLGAAGGGFVGIALALGLAFLDRRVRSRLDLQRAGVGKALILESRPGSAPGDDRPQVADHEDVATFWSRIGPSGDGARGTKLAILPAGGSADAARVATSFAAGLALHGGLPVVLVLADDAGARPDGRDRAEGPGWRAVLRGEVSLAAALRPTSVPGLRLLPPGDAVFDEARTLVARSFVELLDRLCTEHGTVVVALPRAAQAPGAIAVVRAVDAVSIVARVGSTLRKEVEETVAEVESHGLTMAAVVLQPAESDPDHAASAARGPAGAASSVRAGRPRPDAAANEVP